MDLATHRIYEHIIAATFYTSKFINYIDVRKEYLQ